VVNQTVLSTGSNQLGDAANDTQTLYGSVIIPTGSLTVTGSVRSTGGFTGSFSGSVTSPGLTTQIIYNNGGVLGADSGFVYSGSNIGIGTSTPLYKLDVYGNYHQYQAQGLLARYDISTANANQNRGVWDFYTNAAVSPDFFGRFGFKFEGGTADSFKQFQLHVADSTTPKFVVDGLGRVGIGTITPIYTLDVNGTISSGNLFRNNVGLTLSTTSSRAQLYQSLGVDLAYFDGSNTVNGLTLRNTGFVGIGPNIIPSASLHISGASSAALLRVDSPAVNNILFVTGSGRVGIGTNTPTTTLDVSGNGIGLYDGFYRYNIGSPINTGGLNNNYFSLWKSSSKTYFNTFGGIPGYIFQLDGIDRIAIDNNGNLGLRALIPSATLHVSGASNASLLRVESPASSSILFVTGSGRVGINTLTPAYNLDVNGTTNIVGSLTVTGSTQIAALTASSAIINGNLTVLGTASFYAVSSSIVNVGASTITLNTDNPAVRFGGIVVIDSGSFGTSSSGSLLWDSQNNRWIYSNPSGSTYDGGLLMNGPRNTTGLGNEQGTTFNSLMKGQGGDHITSSGIFENSSGSVGIGTSTPSYKLDVVGSGNFSNSLTVTGSFVNILSPTNLQIRSDLSSSFGVGSTYINGLGWTPLIISGSTTSFRTDGDRFKLNGITQGNLGIPAIGVSLPLEANIQLFATGSDYVSMGTQFTDLSGIGGNSTLNSNQNGVFSGSYGNNSYTISINKTYGSNESSLNLQKVNNSGETIALNLNSGNDGFSIFSTLSQPTSSFLRIISGSTNLIDFRYDANYIQRPTIIGSNSSTFPSARLQVKGAGTTSDTLGLKVTDNNDVPILIVQDDKRVGINKANTNYENQAWWNLHVSGTVASNNYVIGNTMYVNTAVNPATNGYPMLFKFTQSAVGYDNVDFQIQGDSNLVLMASVNGWSPLFTVKYDSKVGIGVNNTQPSAQLHVKSAGATSATTAFQVDNYDGFSAFKVKDNGAIENGVFFNGGASGGFSHAEGYGTSAVGELSHAEGEVTTTNGFASHAEGYGAAANGDYSHAEGNETFANGAFSHAEGTSTLASGSYSHAEGNNTTAYGQASHAEGYNTTAYGQASHAEGQDTITYGPFTHAEGIATVAASEYAHTEGIQTVAGYRTADVIDKLTETISPPISGASSKVIFNFPGDYTSFYQSSTPVVVIDDAFVFVFTDTVYSSSYSGTYTTVFFQNQPTGSFVGYIVTSAGVYSHAEGSNTIAYGQTSHAEGFGAVASGYASHAEGYSTTANGIASHAEGYETTASGSYSHAEGYQTITSGSYSHAEGGSTQAIGERSHAEGDSTQTFGPGSHAEGLSTQTIGESSHAEGQQTIAFGFASHAEGLSTQTIGDYSHTEGLGTITDGAYQHAQGKYNISTLDEAAFIVGNGIDDSNRSNLIYAAGTSVQVTGSLDVQGTITNNGTNIQALSIAYAIALG
jgi:hypothetical protein